MSDEEAGRSGTRRGATGQDATVRDWPVHGNPVTGGDASTGPARRQPLLLQGLSAALVAAVLASASVVGPQALVAAVVLLQLVLLPGLLALLAAPARRGALVVAAVTAVGADVAVLVGDGRAGQLAGVTALGLIGALLHELSRRGHRHRVTESMADTLLTIVVGVAAACLIALQQAAGAEPVLVAGLAAAGAALLAGRVVDRLLPRPVLAAGATRGWPGLVVGLAAGVGAGAGLASAGLLDGDLPVRVAALIGLVSATTVATADLAVDLGAAELRAGWRDARRVTALRPTVLLLPYALLGPVLLLAGRLVLS